VVVGVVMLLPLLVNGYCYWLMVTIDVVVHNGHDHQQIRGEGMSILQEI